jgi:hypothetical protein
VCCLAIIIKAFTTTALALQLVYKALALQNMSFWFFTPIALWTLTDTNNSIQNSNK